MRVLIDTNVFLDVFLRREPFFEDSKKVLELCSKKKIQGYITASSVTDIWYMIYNGLHSKERQYEIMGCVMEIVKVLTVTNADVLNAYLKKADDFEAGLTASCAEANRCEIVITRNKKDFKGLGVSAMSPKEFIELFYSKDNVVYKPTFGDETKVNEQAGSAETEDKEDLEVYRSALAEYEADPKTFTLDEVEKELGL